MMASVGALGKKKAANWTNSKQHRRRASAERFRKKSIDPSRANSAPINAS
jgi:hypothetical protein